MKALDSVFKNRKTFEKFLNTPEGEDFVIRHIESSYEIDTEDVFEIPYWMEEWKGQNVLGYWVRGFWLINSPFEFKGKKYVLVDTQPLDTEIEFQLDNGEYYYHYFGYSYIAVIQEVQ